MRQSTIICHVQKRPRRRKRFGGFHRLIFTAVAGPSAHGPGPKGFCSTKMGRRVSSVTWSLVQKLGLEPARAQKKARCERGTAMVWASPGPKQRFLPAFGSKPAGTTATSALKAHAQCHPPILATAYATPGVRSAWRVSDFARTKGGVFFLGRLVPSRWPFCFRCWNSSLLTFEDRLSRSGDCFWGGKGTYKDIFH